MAERYLAVVAGQQVEAEQSDRVDQHLRKLKQMIAAGEEGQRQRGDPEQAEGEPNPRRRLRTRDRLDAQGGRQIACVGHRLKPS